jgi:hypothetical protein
MAATTEGSKLKSGLAPTGVLRQMPVLHNSSQFPNIRPWRVKRQTSETGPPNPRKSLVIPNLSFPFVINPNLSFPKNSVIPTARALLHARRNLSLSRRRGDSDGPLHETQQTTFPFRSVRRPAGFRRCCRGDTQRRTLSYLEVIRLDLTPFANHNDFLKPPSPGKNMLERNV